MTNGDSRKRAAAAMAGVLLAGAALGVAATRVFEHRLGGRHVQMSSDEYRERLLNKLTADLDLDEGQQASVDEILDEIGARFQEVINAIEPEFEAIRAERAARIMALLDGEQQAKYEALLAERRERREARSQRQHLNLGRGGP